MIKKGRIIKALSGFYYVLADEILLTCKARGKFKKENITPLVGDFVIVNQLENDTGQIVKIEERKNELYRPKISNIDFNIIVISAKEPNFSSKLLDKNIVLNEFLNVETIIIFSKMDILNEVELIEIEKVKKYYEQLGYEVYTNSNKDIKKLKESLYGKFVAISGQSGVGKSTFINNLSDGRLKIKTSNISKALGRGKHTTRHIEFYKIDNFYIADTPGFSSLDISFINKEVIKNLFKEFRKFSCKFKMCNHINEPQCAIKDSINENFLKERYNNYKEILKEIDDNKVRY